MFWQFFLRSFFWCGFGTAFSSNHEIKSVGKNMMHQKNHRMMPQKNRKRCGFGSLPVAHVIRNGISLSLIKLLILQYILHSYNSNSFFRLCLSVCMYVCNAFRYTYSGRRVREFESSREAIWSLFLERMIGLNFSLTIRHKITKVE